MRYLYNNIKSSNIYIIGILAGEERGKSIEYVFEEIRAVSFPILGREKDKQVQKSQRVLNKMDTKRPKPRHIITKMAKVKHRKTILKAERRVQQITYMRKPSKSISWFLNIRIQARRSVERRVPTT